MPNAIGVIAFRRIPPEILEPVIGRSAVIVASLHAGRTRPCERLEDELVNLT